MNEVSNIINTILVYVINHLEFIPNIFGKN